MAETVRILVNVDDVKALSSLQTLKSLCDKLNKTPVEIKINNGNGEKVTASLARVVTATEKTKQESLKLSQQQEKTAQSTNRLNQQMVKGASQTTKATSATQKATSAQKSYNQQAQQGSKVTQILGDSLGNIAVKVAAWQLINGAVAGVKNSLIDALGTIKEVDSELATIRKVTGMTKEETQELGEGAYSTASQYGVEASEYLQNVASFARAGYGEAAQGLGELAIKTQLVGDTNAETASQFLLSADAAWKYKGNVELLSSVLDKANVIDNNYATSIEKIAEGIPIVGNVAAMAGMTADETMAALGTITATTQETGRKAATALRALILNILGDTSTEIEEGVTATEESVESLGQILAKYAPEAVAAAEATGKLINPMEAIEALSKAAKEGLMTEADMMQLVSSLGGKLRTNQLMSLLENFDMYKSMLGEMATAAGSADKEIEIMLDTWEGRANQLKNSWTELISSVTNTEVIKGALQGLTGILDALNSDFGQTAIQATLFVGAGLAIVGVIGKIVGSVATFSASAIMLSTQLGMLGIEVGATQLALSALGATLLSNPLFLAAAGGLAIAGIIGLVDKLSVSFEEQAAIVDELEAEQAKLYGAGGEVEQLRANVDNLTASEKVRLSVLEAQEQVLQRQIDEARQLEYEIWSREQGGRSGRAFAEIDEEGNYTGNQVFYENNRLSAKIKEIRGEINLLNRDYDEGMITTEAYTKGLSELFEIVEERGGDTLREYAEAGIELTESEQDLLRLSEELAEAMGIMSDSTSEAAEPAKTLAESLNETAEAADAAESALKGYEEALKGLEDHEANAKAMKSAYDKAVEDFQAGKLNTPNIRAFIDEATTAEFQRDLNYSSRDIMNAAMNGVIGEIYSNADGVSAGAYDVIAKYFKAGLLEGIVEMENGEITKITSFPKLAEALGGGINAGWLQGAFEGLIAYSDQLFYTGEQANAIWNDVNTQLQQTNKVSADGTVGVRDLVSAFQEVTGAVGSIDLMEQIDAVFSGADLDWLSIFGVNSIDEARAMVMDEIESMAVEAESVKNEISADPAKVKIEVESENLAAEAAAADATVESALSDKEVKITPKVDESKAKIPEIPDETFEIKADGSSAESTASGVKGAVESIPRSKQITISAFDYASHIIAGIKSSLQALPNTKTITITTVQQSYTTQPGVGYTPYFAEGTDYFAGGKALVNDGEPVGGSAAELIVDKGRAFIANSGEPAVVDLSPGAKVYTATETRDIFEGGISDIFPAFAGGTGLGRPPVSANTGVYSGGYSGGTGAGGAGATDRQSEDDAFRKEINDKLNNIDKQIELARNRNDTAKEQALLQEAAKLTKNYVQQYLNKGFANTSDEVLDLLNRGYGYSDDLMNELVDSLEALTNATNQANKLEEKKQAVEDARAALENAREQRTVRIFNAATNQFEWVAKAEDVLKAEEALIRAEKELQQEQIAQELEALKSGNIGDIGSLTVSGALRELMGSASEEEQRRITDILNAISGGAKNTVDNTGYSVFRSSDSHNVYYQFGDLKLSEGDASKMTVKQLADQLRALAIT